MGTLKVFISYSSTDKEKADEICEYLEKHGKKCWIAPRDISAGAQYGEEIINGIENSNVVVLIFSKAANESQHVLREVERAVNKKIPVIAFKIENSVLSKSMEYFLLSNQWLDAVDDMQGMLEPLSDSIDKIYKLNSRSVNGDAVTPGNTVRATNKAVPIMLGAVALAIVAVAIVIVAVSGSRNIDVSGNIQGSVSDTALSEDTDLIPKATLPQDTTAGDTTVTDANQEYPQFCAGEFITFGRYYPTGYTEEYNDGEIKWQILECDAENGTLKLISAQIIDVKPFDCSESGKFDFDIDGNRFNRDAIDSYTDEQMKEFRGANDWLTSDLRAWLNAAGAPHYYGLSFGDKATSEFGNGFNNQPGFLSSFTKNELALICETASEENETDKVTLLSYDEVIGYAENPNLIIHTTLTESAAASDKTSWVTAYQSNGIPDYLWVTRTPTEYNSYQIYAVESSMAHELLSSYDAATSGFGIRPVITVKYTDIAPSQISGDGTTVGAYNFNLVN